MEITPCRDTAGTATTSTAATSTATTGWVFDDTTNTLDACSGVPDARIISRALCDLLSDAASWAGGGSFPGGSWNRDCRSYRDLRQLDAVAFLNHEGGGHVRLELIGMGGAGLLLHTGHRGVEDHVAFYEDEASGRAAFGSLCACYRVLEASGAG